ncbi:MAG: hypothetical protein PSV13_00040 [Lacunisphaera sp.]|nr:hypothetical protein [Lacunisphaera sp.]
MKPHKIRSILMGMILLCASGSEGGMLLDLRNQFRQPEQYFVLKRIGPSFTIRFVEPLIHRAELASLGVGDSIPANAEARMTYDLMVNGRPARPVEVGLQFSGDRLLGISLPVVLYELLGPGNILFIMRVAGGAGNQEWRGEDISTQQVSAALIAAGLGKGGSPEKVVIKMVPVQRDAKTLTLTIERPPGAETYKSISVAYR